MPGVVPGEAASLPNPVLVVEAPPNPPPNPEVGAPRGKPKLPVVLLPPKEGVVVGGCCPGVEVVELLGMALPPGVKEPALGFKVGRGLDTPGGVVVVVVSIAMVVLLPAPVSLLDSSADEVGCCPAAGLEGAILGRFCPPGESA